MDTDSSKLLRDPHAINYGTLPVWTPPSCMEFCGYRRVKWQTVICYIFCALTLGLLFIIFHWKPRLYLLATHRRCHLAVADKIFIKDTFGQTCIVDVQVEHGVDPGLHLEAMERLGTVVGGSVALSLGEEEEFKDTIRLHYKEEKNVLRYFVFEGMRYIWSDRSMDFIKVSSLNDGLVCGEIKKYKSGLSQADHDNRKIIYGQNEIDVPVKSYLQLLIGEVLNPFYIFQVFSIVLWLCDNYYYYAVCILVISIISIVVSLYETRKQSVTLSNMVKMVMSLRVRRAGGEELLVSSLDLVPGDCILLPPEGMFMPCDAALLSGECIVNESMLTGESVPEMKTPLPDGPHAADTVYSTDAHHRHTLFGGTQVIQAKSYLEDEVIAVVVKTGFCTVKGNLISSILHPKPIQFKFYRDALMFVLILAVFAAMGTIYSIVIHIIHKVTASKIVILALDVITIIVPPALPAAMTVGTIYAQNRLKKHGIFCISPPRINVSGKLKMVCFDKTDGHLLYSLAACHSVTLLNGQSIGDLMDLKMVESTGWVLEDGDVDPQQRQSFGTKVLLVLKPPSVDEQPHGPKNQTNVGVLQRFPFSSNLQRMSVIAKVPGDCPSELYMKGAPEMVASLCKNETVPPDFSAMLRQYTQDGYRVLGFAHKTLQAAKTFEEAQSVTRESAERDLTFLGFLVMRNVLKPETAPVIYALRKANIRTVMVTGDNMLTAVNVAKSCHLLEPTEKLYFVNASPPIHNSSATLKFIPSEPMAGEQIREGLYQQGGAFLDRGLYCFAMNGKSFAALSDYYPDLLPKILIHATVFARMSPDQKTQLVRSFQDLNYCVGMCGDGANDCGALKAADVGISLSDTEASVASPFTSKLSNIECVPIVIREGRCSLETSFEVFKYMAMYSLTQFISVLILYTVGTNLGDFQFLYIDLVITTTVAILMGRTGPASDLGSKCPLGTLISISVLGSLIFQTSLILAVQLVSYFLTTSQPWFVPVNMTSPLLKNLPNYADTAVFYVSGLQYLILAVVMSKGYPFRKPLYTNVLFLIALIVLLAMMLWIIFYPLRFMVTLLDLKLISDLDFKFVLIGIVAVNFIAAIIIEQCQKGGKLNFNQSGQTAMNSGNQYVIPPADGSNTDSGSTTGVKIPKLKKAALDHGYLNCLRKLRRKNESKKAYKRLQQYLQGQHSWPPINQTLYPSQVKPSR